MRCKENYKITCFDITHNCLKCRFRKTYLLTRFTDILENDEAINENRKVFFCPFCFHKDYLIKFTQEKSRMMKCPECHNEMYESTLRYVLDLPIEKFAEWIWKYPRHEFWRKCLFNKFNERLYILKISQQFWDSYNRWKGEQKKD